MYTLGLIGTGTMGSTLARAAAKTLAPAQMVLSDSDASKAEALAAQLNCTAANSRLVCAESKYIMLGVKPQVMPELLSELAPVLKCLEEPFVLVTMAAGLSISRIQELAGGEYPVIRIMPNTPCAIGSGAILCCRSANVEDTDYLAFQDILSQAGILMDLNEHLIDAGCAISGCGPAFVYTFLEAMSDAGVACGLSRKDALTLAASTVQGAAAMVMQSGSHPAQLRDQVCSPGGSTIAGVLRLESGGFRAAVAECVLAAFERTKELGK